MRVFVLGSSGMLGTYLYNYFLRAGYDVVGVTRQNMDVTAVTPRDLYSSGIKAGDVVINCIGVIKQRPDISKVEFLLVNSVFPRLLSDVCENIGAKFIQITTDCVFDATEGGYVESSPHSAMDIYGRSKSLGEPENATVIRTSIIGEELYNKLSLVEWVKANTGKTVNGFINHFWNGITCLQFAKICDHIIKNNLFWCGVKHVYSPNKISKFGLILAISNIYGLGVKIKEFSTQERCDRTLRSERFDVIIDVPPLASQIEDMKQFKLIP